MLDLKHLEIKIDEEIWYIPKLKSGDSYPLFLDVAKIFVSAMNSGLEFSKENTMTIEDIFLFLKSSVEEIARLFPYEKAVYLASKCLNGGQQVPNEVWNFNSPLLIIELLINVIKHNVMGELQKKDFSAFLSRVMPRKPESAEG